MIRLVRKTARIGAGAWLGWVLLLVLGSRERDDD
jgi:hypothetical protein